MTHSACPCKQCCDDFREWANDRNHLEEIIAADPEKTVGHRYADEVEWRDRLNDLAPVITHYPRTPHPEWGGLVLTANFIEWFVAAPFVVSTSQV